MADLIKSLIVGMLTGAVFGLARLPVPAPPVLAGVLGVVGIYLGYTLMIWWRK